MLDAVIEYLPSPTEVKAIEGTLEDGETVVSRPSNDDEPFSALAFKIATDPFVGTLTFFRVYSGKLESGTGVYNAVKQKKERVGEWCRCTPTAVKKSKKCWRAILQLPLASRTYHRRHAVRRRQCGDS